MKESRRKRSKTELPKLDPRAMKRLTDAFDELVDISAWDVAEWQVGADNLADALRVTFFNEGIDPFVGRDASLVDVLLELRERFRMSDKALEAAFDLQDYIEDSYREDIDSDIEYEIREAAEALVQALRSEIK
jgi:hypothetical protein